MSVEHGCDLTTGRRLPTRMIRGRGRAGGFELVGERRRARSCWTSSCAARFSSLAPPPCWALLRVIGPALMRYGTIDGVVGVVDGDSLSWDVSWETDGHRMGSGSRRSEDILRSAFIIIDRCIRLMFSVTLRLRYELGSLSSQPRNERHCLRELVRRERGLDVALVDDSTALGCDCCEQGGSLQSSLRWTVCIQKIWHTLIRPVFSALAFVP